MKSVRFDKTVLFIFDFATIGTDDLQPRQPGWADLFRKLKKYRHQIAILHLSDRAQDLYSFFDITLGVSPEQLFIHSRVPTINGINQAIQDIARHFNHTTMTK